MTDGSNISKKELLAQFQVDENELINICGKNHVKSLAIFGSGLRPEFIKGKSDLDFLVDFEEISFDRFFNLIEDLKILFRYKNIDLITTNSLKNQIIREEILSSQELLYAA